MPPRAVSRKTVQGRVVCEGQWGPPVFRGARSQPPAFAVK